MPDGEQGGVSGALRRLLSAAWGAGRRSQRDDEGATFRQAWLRSTLPPADPEAAEVAARVRAALVRTHSEERMASEFLRRRFRAPEGLLPAGRWEDGTVELLGQLEARGSPVPVRLLAAVRLGGPAGESVRGRLFSLYRLAGGDVRLAAAVALGCAGDPRVVDGLIEGLEHEHADARFAAVSALGILGPDARLALDAVAGLITRERDRDVRRAAVEVCGQILSRVRRGPTELLAAEAPGGRGTEPEAAAAPTGRGTELEASSVPDGRGTEPEAASAPAGSGDEPEVGDPLAAGGTGGAPRLSP